MQVPDGHQVGQLGPNLVERIVVRDLGWIYRPGAPPDVGIDAQIEVCEANTATGMLLGAQIKTGPSWFSEAATGGWVFRPRKPNQVEYWLNGTLPVLILLVNPIQERVYWELVSSRTAERTGMGWKIIVPHTQELNASSRAALYCHAYSGAIRLGIDIVHLVRDVLEITDRIGPTVAGHAPSPNPVIAELVDQLVREENTFRYPHAPVRAIALVRSSVSGLTEYANPNLLFARLDHQRHVSVGGGDQGYATASWRDSLPELLSGLSAAGLGHVEVLLEHRLPHTPKRVKVLLCGTDPNTKRAAYVLLELKTWSKATPLGEDLVRVKDSFQPVLHPLEQVKRYCDYLVDTVPMLAQRPEAVYGLAYLPNAREIDVGQVSERAKSSPHAQLYTSDSREALFAKLRAILDTSPEAREGARAAADELLQARHAASKTLVGLSSQEVNGHSQFTLLDEQHVAYSLVKQAVERADTSQERTVVVVVGGPGTGKSAIAVSLLSELARSGRKVIHATGSSAFTNTLRKHVGRQSCRTQSIFKYFNNFVDAEALALDVLVCDESHRIRETSVNRYTSREARDRAGRQIDELIDAARVTVFLLDEDQIVRPGESGTLAEITSAAHAKGCHVAVVRLDGQFRCGGAELFDEWVERLLGSGGSQSISWTELTSRAEEDYIVHHAETPGQMESWLKSRQDALGGTARLSAGFCWRWSDPVRSHGSIALVSDVRIGDWSRPWNAKPANRVPGVPESYFWATDERGFGQIGCIYTAQGFEYDWAGVIFGGDFVRRGDRWVARPEYSHDPAVKRASLPQFSRLIRSTYRILLTRGMRGVCVYSVDPETQDYLHGIVR